LHLEFKQATADMTRDDRKNLAKALSGFANADGGIVIWGIKTERLAGNGCATDVSPIAPLSTFLSKLNEFTGEAANPLVDGVIHKGIESSADSGFAVTLVPASDSGPHMAKLGEDRYYKRSGSRFAKMEHYEVADMFGRRQRPLLELSYRLNRRNIDPGIGIVTQVTLALKNSGRGSAKAPFLDVTYPSEDYYIDLAKGIHGGRSGALVKPVPVTAGRRFFVGYADFVVHPGVGFDFAELVNIKTISTPLTLSCQIAAENYQLKTIEIDIPPKDLLNA
jgi:hypothetical protein